MSGLSDFLLQNKSPPKSHIWSHTYSIWPVLSLILASSKKETPCFHRPVSSQIDSPLPHGVTQPVSRRSDVALQNKSPPKSHIWPILSLILDSSKKETPCFHRPVSIQIDSPLPHGVTQPVSRRSDVALQNKSLPKTHIWQVLSLIWKSSKRETPFSTEQFEFRLTVHYPRVSLNQLQDCLMLHYIIKTL